MEEFVLYKGARLAGPISLYRGDSYPLKFVVKDAITAVPVDITGYSFLLTVNGESEPSDITQQQLQLVGVVDQDGGSDLGAVYFTPSSVQTDLADGMYYYDIQITGAGSGRTLVKSTLTIVQDIGKNVSSTTEHTLTFDNDDLVNDILTVNHGLNESYPLVTVYDSAHQLVDVTVTPIDGESYSINFGGAISGMWVVTTRIIPGRLSLSFANDDLVNDILTVNHGLGSAYPFVAVYDDVNTLARVPVTTVSTTQFTINFGGSIAGNWNLTAI